MSNEIANAPCLFSPDNIKEKSIFQAKNIQIMLFLQFFLAQ